MRRRGEDFTASMMYTLASIGFDDKILDYGMDVILRVINYGNKMLRARRKGGRRGRMSDPAKVQVIKDGEDTDASEWG